MVFTTAGGGATQETGYEISNSLRFNDGDTARLTNDPGGGSGSDGSRTQFSISMWVKRSTLGLGDNTKQQALISASATNNFYGGIKFNGSDKIQINLVNSGSDQDEVVTDAVYRDVSAWYHLFFVFDKTQAALADGIKLYVNGVQQTFGTTTYAQNQGYHFSRPGKTTAVGVQQVDTSSPFDGYMAEIHFIDGQLKAHTDFGETNDNGVWIPKEYDGTYGTYGFYLEFKQTGTSEDSSGIGADTSGNDEHFAVTNLAATDVTEDTPTNNFCTWNSLANYHAGSTFSEGNCYITMADSVSTFNAGTFGLTSGKWYWETKVINIGSGSDNFLVGAVSRPDSGGTTDYLGEPTSVVYRNNGNIKKDSANATHGASYGVNDIVMVALDCDNNNIYFGSNGNWADGSGNNDESSPTSAVAFTNTMINDGIVFPAQGDLHGNTPNPIASTNFGNPPHSISSGNADVNGYGNFEYAVPSGYYALCTKNLAEYG